MSILDSLQDSMKFLRRDGFFIKATMASEDTILLEASTYVMNAGTEDADCLCVHEDELGLGGPCVCEAVTSGRWLAEGAEPPANCVTCPVCERLTKPRGLQKREFSAILQIHDEFVSLKETQPNPSLKPMPLPMSEKIIEICNVTFPVISLSSYRY